MASRAGSNTHADWGSVASAALLPNAAGAPLGTGRHPALQVGDVATVLASGGQKWYCTTVGGVGAAPPATWAQFQAVGQGPGAILMWAARSITSNTTPRFLYAGGSTRSGTAGTAEVQFVLPRGGTVQRMHVQHNTPGGTGAAVTYTLRANGVGTLLAATVASTAATGSDVINTASVFTGTRLSIRVTKAASIGAGGTIRPIVTVEFL